MSIAIVCNLSDGVIFGTDSAITVTSSVKAQDPHLGLIVKVYNQAEKVFRVAELPVGIVNFGVGMMEARSIGSYIEEFEATIVEPRKADFEKMMVKDIATEIGKFFYGKYKTSIEDKIKQQATSRQPDESEQQVRMPVLGLVVAGFSPGDYLAEVFDASIPAVIPSKQPNIIRQQGNFGSNWFGNFLPISRLIKGMDPGLVNKVIDYFVKERGMSFTDNDRVKLQAIVGEFENQIPYAAMPLKEGVEHVQFLLDIVIGITRWVVGAPICGGPTSIGVVRRNQKLEYLTQTS